MALSKKTRFEVFKRDKFTCQYCGKAAPDVVLHADHIHPASRDGSDDLLNLVTSCKECNLGKGARLLSDDTVVKKRKTQLDELQERREQLEMLMEWHKSLIDLGEQTVEELADFWDTIVPGYHLSKTGLRSLGKWVRKYSVNELIDSMQTSVSQYLKYGEGEDKPTPESVEKAWQYVPKICKSKRRMEDKPYLRELYYIRGILRNRLDYVHEWKSVKIMERAVLAGIPTEQIKEFAIEVSNWSSFRDTLETWIEEGDNGAG